MRFSKPFSATGAETNHHRAIEVKNHMISTTEAQRLTQKQGLVLIHARVGEEQGGIIDRHTGTAGPEGVTVLLHEEVDEGLADLLHGPLLEVVLRAHLGRTVRCRRSLLLLLFSLLLLTIYYLLRSLWIQ